MRPFIIENCKSKMSRASRWLLGEEKFNSGSETLPMSFLFLINWKVSQFQICVQKMTFKWQSNILHKNVFFHRNSNSIPLQVCYKSLDKIERRSAQKTGKRW